MLAGESMPGIRITASLVHRYHRSQPIRQLDARQALRR